MFETVQYIILTLIKVPLGCLPKSETLNEDIVKILETIQNEYVPLVAKGSGQMPADFITINLLKKEQETYKEQGWTVSQFLTGWKAYGQKIKIGMQYELHTR